MRRKRFGMDFRHRRTFLRGAVSIGAFALVAGGGFIWWKRQSDPHPLYTYHAAVTALQWSPRSADLAFLSQQGGLQIWDTANQRTVHSDSTLSSSTIGALAWSPDCRYLAAVDHEKTLKVWSIADWKLIMTYQRDAGFVRALQWSPDSTRIALGSSNKQLQLILVENRPSGELLYTYEKYADEVSAIAWSPDGSRLVSGSWDSTVHILDSVSGKVIFTYHGHAGYPINTVGWAPHGQYIASASGSQEDDAHPGNYAVRVWDAKNGTDFYRYAGHTKYVLSLAWSPDGARIASASEDSTVQVWRPANNSQAYIYRGHTAFVRTVTWSPTSKKLASASDDDTLQIWQPF